MRRILCGVAVLVAAVFSILGAASLDTALAQQNDGAGTPSRQALARERANQHTVTIISGNPNGTYLRIAYDMVAVLDKKDELRVLAVIGKGAAQNMKDILRLKGIDMGILQSDTMEYYKGTGELGKNIDRRIAYIAKLYNEEMHVLAGGGINSIQELEGKRVNFSDVGSGTQLSARAIFKLLGIKVKEVNMGQADAYAKIKSGEISATVLFSGKPSGSFGSFELAEGMKVLDVPYTKKLEKNYFPAKLTAQDYPKLIAKDRVVNTIAIGSVLAVYNWPKKSDRYRKVAKFVNAFFDNIAKFSKEPRHPKWKEINLAAVLPSWKRFPAAQEWLDRAAARRAAMAKTARLRSVNNANRVDLTAARREAIRAAPDDPAMQKKLFNQFLLWLKNKRKLQDGLGAAQSQ